MPCFMELLWNVRDVAGRVLSSPRTWATVMFRKRIFHASSLIPEIHVLRRSIPCKESIEPPEWQNRKYEKEELPSVQHHVPGGFDVQPDDVILHNRNGDDIRQKDVSGIFGEQGMAGVEQNFRRYSLREGENGHLASVPGHDEVVTHRAEPLQADAYKEHGEEDTELFEHMNPQSVYKELIGGFLVPPFFPQIRNTSNSCGGKSGRGYPCNLFP